jgi:hypothetical protein
LLDFFSRDRNTVTLFEVPLCVAEKCTQRRESLPGRRKALLLAEQETLLLAEQVARACEPVARTRRGESWHAACDDRCGSNSK